ncbi:TatD family hydrolase [Candidatus Gracilibacteria bacterium]|nr:TatD family hydrolase [Candidatus Gracilibacteria bacterium]
MIDTHCHLYRKNMPKIEETLANAEKVGVKKFVNVGTDISTTKKAFEQAKKFDKIFFTAGIHPVDSNSCEIDWQEFENFLKEKKCLAVGECGFDFYHQPFDEKIQDEVFLKQKELAKKYDLPLVIHNRNAGMKIFDFLEKGDKFVIHCFSENAEFAKKVVEFDGMISVGGILTYPKAYELREIIKNFPLEKIMLETDAPFLAPQKFRGKPNQSAFMKEVLIKISELKNMNILELEEILDENSEKFFGFENK